MRGCAGWTSWDPASECKPQRIRCETFAFPFHVISWPSGKALAATALTPVSVVTKHMDLGDVRIAGTIISLMSCAAWATLARILFPFWARCPCSMTPLQMCTCMQVPFTVHLNPASSWVCSPRVSGGRELGRDASFLRSASLRHQCGSLVVSGNKVRVQGIRQKDLCIIPSVYSIFPRSRLAPETLKPLKP